MVVFVVTAKLPPASGNVMTNGHSLEYSANGLV
jgi:hypothetical protein